MYKELFEDTLYERLSQSQMNMEMYKEIKKRYNFMATFYDEDFNVDESFTMKLSNGSKVKVLINTTDFNKPVFWFEWI